MIVLTNLGRQRRLRRCANASGTFTVLAIDHRGPLRRHLAAHAPDLQQGALDVLLADVKEDIVRELGPLASAVLLDPEVGLPRCLASHAIPAQVGLLAALDTGSTGDPGNVCTGLVPDWSAEKALRAGADGAKLLVYYEPGKPTAVVTEELVRRIAMECAEQGLPLYLEPLVHLHDRSFSALSPMEKRRLVVETARCLAPLGVDVMKVQFPGGSEPGGDLSAWREACEELTSVCPVPWVLLSGGVSFETFLVQARVAGEAGASGFIAGRAIWDGALDADPDRRKAFLTGEARVRLKRLSDICAGGARPVPGCIAPDGRPVEHP